jgi:hypothetical protein
MRYGPNIFAVACAVMSGCGAHMTLKHPVPYGNATLNNSPLQQGSDYPCKQRRGVYDIVEMNHWTAGGMQTISFSGTAVHGGGSCQFSITTDLEPTQASSWKVLHSVIGGCPSDAEGNLSPGESSSVISFALPKDIPAGQYTFAWTWLNRRGSREFYMNCAPITVESDAKDTDFLYRLPDMFVANLPSSACATPDELDFVFPQPGASVTTATGAKLGRQLLGTGCAAVTRLGSGSGTMPSPSAPGTGMPINHVEAIPDDRTMSGNQPQPLTLTRSTMVPISLQTASVSSRAYGNGAGIRPASLAPQASTCVRCGNDGSVICIDEQHFGICFQGCAARQLLAAGTRCRDGIISK